MTRNIVAVLAVALVIPTGAALAATQPAISTLTVHAGPVHKASTLKSRDPIGDEETNALNVLAANGYSGMTNLRVHGDQVFAEAKKNNEEHHVVVTSEDTITPAT